MKEDQIHLPNNYFLNQWVFFPIFISSYHNDDHNTINENLHSKDSKKIEILKQNVLGFLLAE